MISPKGIGWSEFSTAWLMLFDLIEDHHNCLYWVDLSHWCAVLRGLVRTIPQLEYRGTLVQDITWIVGQLYPLCCRQPSSLSLMCVLCQIFRIVSQLPNLRHLNLSSNPLKDQPDLTSLCEDFSEDSLKSLEHLILNNTDVSLETIYRILHCFPG